MGITRSVSMGVMGGVLLTSAAASADVTKPQCIDANTKGQELRREGKLSAAGGEFRTCTAPACPALLRDDCARRLDEIERVQPTIVFDAKDASGRDVSAVKVTVDGAPLADRLTGAPLPVDPGEHVFSFEVAGQAPVSQTFVIKESERDRRERIVVGGAAGSASAPTSTPAGGGAPAGEAPQAGGAATRKLVGEVAMGVGAAGVVVGSVFGIMAITQASQQKTDCASSSNCNDHGAALSDHSSASTYGTISTASFIAGGVLLGAGAVLFFTAGHPAEPGATTALVVTPSIGPGAGGMLLKGEF